MPNRIEGNVHIDGQLSCKTLNIPSGTVNDDDVAADAAIAASKLGHQFQLTYGQPNTAATTETRVVHVVHGAAGEIRAFEAGSIAVAVGDSTVTLDLQKNGTTVLTGVITLDSGNTARVTEAGTIDPAQDTLADGDVLEIVITATVGTGTLPTGLFASVKLREDAD